MRTRPLPLVRLVALSLLLGGCGGGGGGSGDEGAGGGGYSGENDVPLVRGPAPTIGSASAPGPYTADAYVTGFRDGPDYADATIWFPIDAEPPFGGVAVVPGFSSTQATIASWGPFLASHGIVTITIGTNSPGDGPSARSRALLDAVETIRSEHTRTGSPLEGSIDVDRMGVMGWSMGGGGALIALDSHPEIRAGISLCGFSPGASFSDIRSPILLFAASADPLAGGQSQGFYASVPAGTPKMLLEVTPGSHAVANDPANLGGEIGRYGLSWLKVFLERDERYRPFLTQPPTTPVSEFQSNL